MHLPDQEQARAALAATAGAFASSGGFDDLQATVFASIASAVYGIDVVADPIEPLDAATFARRVPDRAVRRHAVSLIAVLEMVAHPLTPAAAGGVRTYVDRLGIHRRVLQAASDRANHHLALMRADFCRSSWYTRQTIEGSLHGRFLELAASKLAYAGVVVEPAIANRWLALADCPEGSWGREVAAFYERHRFPFPGTSGGIYELGAKHDWVHVLAGYDADPEGEIDVFGFIAASMPADDGDVLLAVTMGIFQNGSIHRVGGKRVAIACVDTLAHPGAPGRFADALRRGAQTQVDVLSLDQFAFRDVPLDEVREQFGVVPPAG